MSQTPIPSNQHTITYIIRQRSRIRYSLKYQDLRQFAPSHPPTTLASRLLSDRLIDNISTSSYPMPTSLATPEGETFIRHSSIMLSVFHQQTPTLITFMGRSHSVHQPVHHTKQHRPADRCRCACANTTKAFTRPFASSRQSLVQWRLDGRFVIGRLHALVY